MNLKWPALLTLAARAALAQCSGCTTIVGPVQNPDHSAYNGTLFVRQSASFVSADGQQNLVGPPLAWTVTGGTLSELLEPNDTASPPGTYYTITSAVTGLVSLVCRVPTSGSSVTLLSVCTSTIPVALTSSQAGSFSSASANLTFGTILDGTCADETFSFSGLPAPAQLNPEWPTSLPAGFQGMAISTGAGTADIRLCNLSGSNVTLGTLAFGVTRSSYTLAGSAALTFPALVDGGCGQESLFLPGVLPGDTPTPIWPATFAGGLQGLMFVSSPGTIAVNVCNWSGAPVTPSYTYGAAVAR